MGRHKYVLDKRDQNKHKVILIGRIKIVDPFYIPICRVCKKVFFDDMHDGGVLKIPKLSDILKH